MLSELLQFRNKLVRKNMDVFEHEILSNVTRRHKIKYRNSLVSQKPQIEKKQTIQ